jgi:periplasmic protein TonB
VDSQPEPIGEVRGEYTDEAKKAEVEGSVMLKITIDVDGRVVDVVLVRGLGYGLDEVAIASVKKLKWKPAIKAGEMVSTTIPYKFNFYLE